VGEQRRRPNPVAIVALVALLLGAAVAAALIEELLIAVPLLAVAGIGAALAILPMQAS
jgi:hypothetical protein